VGRGWRFGAHDSGQHAGRAVRLEVPQQVGQVVFYSVTPFDLNAAQTLSGPIGMSMLVMPYGDSASMTALT
jgi:hypothetical protein